MQTNNTKLISYFLLILSFFILLFFTKNTFFDMQSSLARKSTMQEEVKQKRAELTRLEGLKNISNPNIEKYMKTIQENDIVDYIYGLIESLNTTRGLGGVMTVKSLSIGKGKQNEYGFLESDIKLVVEVSSETKMKQLLDAFVASDAPYKMFIDAFSYEIPTNNLPEAVAAVRGQKNEPFTVTIPLKIFYK